MGLLTHYSDLVEAGCDEAGRGCLAGPVVAAAVILKKDSDFPELNDSKQLTEKKRMQLREVVMQEALTYSVGIVTAEEIDKINILNASFLAMHRALNELKIQPELLLIDGNRFNPYRDIKHICIVGGDAKYQSIAAASILAKTYRDELMCRLDAEFPAYDWRHNKGYPSPKHIEAVRQYGLTPYHRRSFHLKNQLSLEF